MREATSNSQQNRDANIIRKATRQQARQPSCEAKQMRKGTIDQIQFSRQRATDNKIVMQM